MAKKQLNREEILKLCDSPHVVSVTSSRICFTPEFKKIIYDGLSIGKTVRIVLEEHGIDPEILGEQRLGGIAVHLRKYAARDEGFEDLRKNNSRKTTNKSRKSAKETKEQTFAERVAQLENELAYTKQEVEFLKKIRMADLEAQKLWESKQRRK